MNKRQFSLSLIALALCAATLLGMSPPAAHAQDASLITLKDATIRPEGIAYLAASGTWLVSSTGKGTIFEVAVDGSVKPFIEDKDLKATLGLYIDTGKNLLYVVNSNFLSVIAGGVPGGLGANITPPAGFPTPNGTPGAGFPNGTPPAELQALFGQIDFTITLNIYDLKTKQRTQRIDLTKVASAQGPRLVNDVAVDAQGNAYVTDSLASAIYRVDPAGAPAYLSNPSFAAQGFGLNGIVFHPDGYLIVGKTSDGSLFKIPLADPSKVTPIKLSEPVTGADGIRLRPDGKLAIVGGQGRLLIVSSADKWDSAKVEQKIDIAQGSTSVTMSDKEMFVLQAGLALGFGGPGGQPGAQQPTTPTAATIKRLPM